MPRDNSRPMLENRKSPRRKMVLPVKMWIDKGTHLAHTIDIAPRGARLGALRQKLQVGTIVILQRGPKKAEFRITWVRQLAPHGSTGGCRSFGATGRVLGNQPIRPGTRR